MQLPYRGSAETIETARLRLSPLMEAEWPILSNLYRDVQVRRYLGGVVPEAEIKKKLSWQLEHWAACGFGQWSVYEKATGLLTGLCGLHYSTEGIEISYSFFPVFWGQGFGAEAARASLDHGFRTLAIEQIVSITQSANSASCHLLEKIGMRHTNTFERWNAEQHYCELTRLEWLARSES